MYFFKIFLGSPTPIWIPDAREWCTENCSAPWRADWICLEGTQENYTWAFSFDDDADKVAFILRWL